MLTLPHAGTAAVPRHALRQLAWFIFGSVVAFAVPYLGVSLAGLQHDLYYLVYFATTVALVAGYVRVEHVDVRGLLGRALPWSIGLGVLTGAAELRNVLSAAATARPHGVYFIFELLWRGVTYGAVDALLLSAFPAFVAYSLLRGHGPGVLGQLRFVAVALPLIWAITASYHLGYPQYREDGIGQPEIGNTIISVPTLATANPLGSVIAHATMHTTAVAHAYATDVYLPPKTKP